MQTIFDRSSIPDPADRKTLLEQLAEQEAQPKDSFRGVRVVLLIGAAISFIGVFLVVSDTSVFGWTSPVVFWVLFPCAFLLTLAWILSLVWPHN